MYIYIFCRFCGYTLPTTKLISTNNEMLLLFRSNVSIRYINTRRGFNVKLQVIDNTTYSTTKKPARYYREYEYICYC